MVNILQAPILRDFLYPFLLIFFIVFAILEKTAILGKEKKQLDAFVSLIVALIFVSAVFPKIVVGNLMLFLTVGLVVVFVGLLLWGFIAGKEGVKIEGKALKWFGGFLIAAVVIAVVWATGLGSYLQEAFAFIFNSSGSGVFWTNFLIIAFIIAAVWIVIGKKGSSSS
ncbi:hypothetical protein HOD29_05445 [archaeon]|jgi:hypothetical protein|nr:hypothetical protein [archaeon]